MLVIRGLIIGGRGAYIWGAYIRDSTVSKTKVKKSTSNIFFTIIVLHIYKGLHNFEDNHSLTVTTTLREIQLQYQRIVLTITRSDQGSSLISN